MMIGTNLKRLIDKYGKDLTYNSFTVGTYVPGSSSVTKTTETYTVKGYFFNYNLKDIDGTKILVGDRQLLISIVDTSGDTIPEPDNNDTFAGQGDLVNVKGVTKIMSGDNPVCYICQVRE